MKVWQIRILHFANLLVGATGLGYLICLYLLSSDDPYSVLNHPWQPYFQSAHVVTSPLLIFAVGWMWNDHVLRNRARNVKQGRQTGTGLMALFFPMAFSGYLLQVATGELWITSFRWLHLLTSVLWMVGSIAHLFQVPKAPLTSRLSG